MTTHTLDSSYRAVLGTVESAASTLALSCDTLASGVEILHAYVENAAENQIVRYAAEESAYETRIIAEVAMRASEVKVAVIKYTSQSQLHKETYEASHAEATLRVAEARARRAARRGE